MCLSRIETTTAWKKNTVYVSDFPLERQYWCIKADFEIVMDNAIQITVNGVVSRNILLLPKYQPTDSSIVKLFTSTNTAISIYIFTVDQPHNEVSWGQARSGEVRR